MPRYAEQGAAVWIVTDPFGGVGRWVATELARQCRRLLSDGQSVCLLDVFQEFLPSSSVLGRFALQQGDRFWPSVTGNLALAMAETPDTPLLRELASGGADRLRARFESERPRWVIAASATAGAIVAESATIDASVVSIYTDFDLRDSWVHPRTDLHVVMSKESREDLVVRGVSWERIMVSGPVETLGDGRGGSRGETDRFSIVISADAGPDDVVGVMDVLAGAGVRVRMVAGGDARAGRSRLDEARRSPLVGVSETAVDVRESIADADLVVARAGSRNLMQALSVGKPCVVYDGDSDTETCNVDFLINVGAALPVRDDADLVSKVLFLSAHPRRLEQMRSQAGGLVVGRAASRICERALAIR